jgi:diguanylate cyclase (GGDEF)-like protein/PAS domain S-box-containing protein
VGLVLLVLLLGLIALAARTLERNSYQNVVQQAEAQAIRVVTGAQTSLNRSLLGVDTLLTSVDDILQLSGTAPSHLDQAQANRLMRSSVEQNQLVRYVALLNVNGQVVASSDRAGQNLPVQLPPDFLPRILNGQAYTVFVSVPLADASDGERVLYLGRMVQLINGHHMVVVAQVPVALLRAVMAQGLQSEGLEVSLETEEGLLLASIPPSQHLEGKLLSTTVRNSVVSGLVDIQPGRLNREPAFLTARRTLYPGIWLVVAVPVQHALAGWQVERRYIWSTAGVVMAGFFVTTFFMLWYLRRLRRATQKAHEANVLLDQALDTMSVGFLVTDPQQRLVRWNAQYVELVPGLKDSLQRNSNIRELFALVSHKLVPGLADSERHQWIDARMQMMTRCGDFELAYPDNRFVRVSVRSIPDGGQVCIVADITHERNAQADLRVAATVFDSQEGMLVTDQHRRIVRINHAFSQMTGFEDNDVVGKDPKLLHAGVHDRAFFQEMWSDIHRQGHWQGEVQNRRKSGEIFHAHLTITAVKDDGDTITHYVGTMLDISARRAAAQEIERLAFYDPLTELPNRRLLMDRLRQALAACSRAGTHGALLFLDLDHFKVLNDTLGHDVGDTLLCKVAKRLSDSLRETDTVARLGGDEFVLLLSDLSVNATEAADQTRTSGEKILSTLNQPYDLAQHQYHCSGSLGAVLFSGGQLSLDDLLRQADLAMYDAKSAGRNTLRFFDPAMQAAMAARASLEKDLRQALSAQQFVLHYQPQVAHHGMVVGAEVLIRWMHPGRGMVSPLQFIALAEETGLIVPIGQWVLHQACQQLRAWEFDARFAHLQLAVNVSARQFRQTDFVQQVLDTLRATGANPELLKLELTESAVVDDVQDIIGKMQLLKQAGVSFSMDDFGTGQSSLSYLTKLPLDQLKIDQSFVHNIGIRSADALMVQTIIGMADSLGLQVVAEGVETEEQRAFLQSHGCPLFQGYLFGKPLDVRAFETAMSEIWNSGFGTTIPGR